MFPGRFQILCFQWSKSEISTSPKLYNVSPPPDTQIPPGEKCLNSTLLYTINQEVFFFLLVFSVQFHGSTCKFLQQLDGILSPTVCFSIIDMAMRHRQPYLSLTIAAVRRRKLEMSLKKVNFQGHCNPEADTLVEDCLQSHHISLISFSNGFLIEIATNFDIFNIKI